MYSCDTTHTRVAHYRQQVWHDSCTAVTRLILEWHIIVSKCDMTQALARVDSCPHVTWLTLKCDVTHHTHVWRDSYFSVSWRMPVCDVTHTEVWRDSSLIVLIPKCDIPHHTQVWHDSHPSMTCLILKWSVTWPRYTTPRQVSRANASLTLAHRTHHELIPHRMSHELYLVPRSYVWHDLIIHTCDINCTVARYCTHHRTSHELVARRVANCAYVWVRTLNTYMATRRRENASERSPASCMRIRMRHELIDLCMHQDTNRTRTHRSIYGNAQVETCSCDIHKQPHKTHRS